MLYLNANFTPAQKLNGKSGSSECVGIVFSNGSSTEFCGDDAATTVYDQHNATFVQWHTELVSARVNVTLTGTAVVSVENTPTTPNATEFSFTLLSASSGRVSVRAVDLNFPFAAVSGTGDKYYYAQSARGFAGGPGCGEWSSRTVSGTVSTKSEGEMSRPQRHLRGGSQCQGWTNQIPWALEELLNPSRSNGVGAWKADGSAGIGFFSSQRTLPFKRFSFPDGTVGFGTARINTGICI
jgi:hypothetical protein